jgi:hypothetical protein
MDSAHKGMLFCHPDLHRMCRKQKRATGKSMPVKEQ